jgi:hypothetical protein
MAKAGIKIAVLILDACRDNPFGPADEALGPPASPRSSRRRARRWWPTPPRRARWRRDGSGPNSPYTAALVSALERPGATLEEVFREVRGRVREATEGLQLPVGLGLDRDRAGAPPERDTRRRRTPAGNPETAAAPAAAPSEGGVTLASVHWRTIEPSRDPNDFRAFLEVQGDTPLAPLARDRLAALEGQAGGPRVRMPGVVSPFVAGTPAAGGGVRGLVTDCDLAVSDDEDFARLADPTRWGLVNTRLALRACSIGLARDPGTPACASCSAGRSRSPAASRRPRCSTGRPWTRATPRR